MGLVKSDYNINFPAKFGRETKFVEGHVTMIFQLNLAQKLRYVSRRQVTWRHVMAKFSRETEFMFIPREVNFPNKALAGKARTQYEHTQFWDWEIH